MSHHLAGLAVSIALCLTACATTSEAQRPARATVPGPPTFASVRDSTLRWSACVNAALHGCSVSFLRGDMANGPAEVFVRFAPLPSSHACGIA